MYYEYGGLEHNEDVHSKDGYTKPVKVPNCRSYFEEYALIMPVECEGCANKDPHQCDQCVFSLQAVISQFSHKTYI